MKIPIYQIDAFSEAKFKGNPAAVCPLQEWLDKKTMADIAAENNLSETAFFVKEKDGFGLRWFTPEIEVPLCGHATLASAHVLFNHLGYKDETIRFYTKSGQLTVQKKDDLLAMNFPARYPKPVQAPADLIEGLGAEPIEVLKDLNFLAVFENEQQVQQLKPNFAVLSRINYAGIICTAPGESSDFVSRYFASYVGINEDPVTGSAHTTLTKFWSQKLNQKELFAKQISKRGGVLYCTDLDDRVQVAGKAVTYLEGTIEI